MKKSTPKKSARKNIVGLPAAFDESSITAEQFREIRTNIQFSSEKAVSTLMVTSAEQSEGTSSVASNLAVSWAKLGKKTIFIDANLRNPSVHDTFCVSNQLGLASMLDDSDVSLKKTIKKTQIKKLSIMTSGFSSENPADLLNSNHMTHLIKELKKDFDMVIFDTPAILPVADGRILATKVDGVILVTPQGIARKHSVIKAAKFLRSVHANLLGAVFNKVVTKNKY
ncbi:CpsD/CapB family tyrosine-protein kinase [Oenococcus sp.]|uniref:CpsD/CapB family tyrosine-protein kinase n=1 Tax=Oenococcus sp. TaxID=1979414 RepID=UPI0039E90AC8